MTDHEHRYADANTAEATVLAQRLREARQCIGLRPEEVARALDMSKASVTAIESAKKRVTPFELRRLGRIYRRSVPWLLGEEEVEANIGPPPCPMTTELAEQEKERILRRVEFRAGTPKPGAVRSEQSQ